MILLTVGTQLPFERLVDTVDVWAAEQGRDDVFAQIGAQEPPPKHIAWTRDLGPADFEARLADAELVIAHAGMGTILNALNLGRPVLVFPRRASLGEHRNEHQIATAKRLEAMGVVACAYDQEQLLAKLRHLDTIVAGQRIHPHASEELLDQLRDFLAAATSSPGPEGRSGR